MISRREHCSVLGRRSAGKAFSALVLASILSTTAVAREDCLRLMARFQDSFERFLDSPRLVQAGLLRPKADDLLALKKVDAEPLFYAMTSDGRMYFSRDPVSSDTTGPLFVVTPGTDAKAEVLPLRESGQVLFTEGSAEPQKSWKFFGGSRSARKTFVFRQTSGLDPTEEEIRMMGSQLEQLGEGKVGDVPGNYRIARTFAEGGAQARVLECSKVLERNTRGQKFILDSVMNTAGLTFGGVALTAPERFLDVSRMNVLAADFVSPLFNTFFKSMTNYFMISRNQSAARRYAVRLGTIGTSVSLQAGIYQLFDVEDAKSIGAYTLGYSLLMIPKGDLVDRFMLQKLPGLAYESCLQNSSMKFIFSPRAIRLVDGLISTVIFLEGRKALIGQ